MSNVCIIGAAGMVYQPDIVGHSETLYKKPGYTM